MKFKQVFILIIISYNLSYSQNGGVWTWIHGDTVSGTKNYGIKGVPSPNNKPPGRYHPAYWQDLNGKFWMFSGSPAPSDMWMYDPVTNMWTWMSGDSTQSNGVYGTKGVPSVNNYPRWRGWGASCWTDSLGDLWMFSGSGLRDLWRYHIPTNEWTWMNGDNPNVAVATAINFGTKGVASTSNFPGTRAECKSNWVYKNSLLLFAGIGGFNDIWSYNISSNLWTWIGGENTTPTVNYGVKGIPSPTNSPPARMTYTKWSKDDKLFISTGLSTTTPWNRYNDLWEFNLTNGMWTWLSGSNAVNDPGNPPLRNCTSSASNLPRARLESHTIQTSKCNNSLWMFGGFVETINWSSYADLWIYNINSNDWVQVSGDTTLNYVGNYGIKGVSSIANHPPSNAGTAIWNDSDGNLYLFGGYFHIARARNNSLWKFEPDKNCIPNISLIGKEIEKPKKTSICTSTDSVVLTLDTFLYNITWNPTSNVTVNTDTSRLVFKPSAQTNYTLIVNGGKCVSIDTLTFTIRIGSHTFDTIVDTTCLTGKYPYTQTGVYDYVIRNTSGCDSNIRLHLTMRNNIDTTKAEICKGSTFLFHGSNYSTSGTFNKTYKNQYNCDSTKVLVLKVNTPDTTVVKATICVGDTFTFKNQKFYTSGDYSFSKDCGMEILSLWVRPTDSFVIFDTFCTGDTFKYQTHTYTSSGSYSHKYTSIDGCDSFMVFNLFVKSKTSDTIRIDSIILDNLCSINNKRIYIFPLNIDGKSKYTRDYGLTYQVNSIFYNLSAGTYPIRIKRGCAFLDTPITLPFRERDTTTINDETCVLFPYYFNGKYITKTGVYWDTFTNVYNCDSFIKLNLIVYKTDSSTIRDTICRGDSVMFDGFPRTTAGAYYKYIKLFEGCDSTVKLILHVKRRDTFISNQTICSGDTAVYAGKKYTQSGTYVHKFINKEGCDSLMILNLSVKRRDTFLTLDTICAGTSFIFEGKQHTKSGVYTYKYSNIEGCDSFKILRLQVNRQDTTLLKFNKCLNDSVVHDGQTYKTSGLVKKMYKNIYDCDSIVYLDLKFSAFETEFLNINICPGSQYLGYKNAGIYADTFKRVGKCDSIRVLTLTLTPLPIYTLSVSVCRGTSYRVGSKDYSFAGIYYDTFKTAVGCDSIQELTLRILDTSSFSYSQFICKNEFYTFNNQNLNLPGTYKDTLRNINGCDSFVNLILSYKPLGFDTIYPVICNNQSYNGYSISGQYSDTLRSPLGCETFRTIFLQVLPPPYFLSQQLEDCRLVKFKNKVYIQSTQVLDTLFNFLGCDSVYRTTHIIIRPLPIQLPLVRYTFCDSIRMPDNKLYRYSFIYLDTIKTNDSLHCDSIYAQTSYVKKSRVSMQISVYPATNEFYKGESVILTTAPADNIRWSTGDTVNGIKLTIYEDKTIEVIGWDSEECKDSAMVNLRVIEPAILDIPNAFAPYGMSENRLFKPDFRGRVEILNFSIFNRWGEKVYHTNTIDNIGWDGSYKGEPSPAGVYSYILEYKANRSTYFKSGEVLLVR